MHSTKPSTRASTTETLTRVARALHAVPLALVLGLAACGGGDPGTDDAGARDGGGAADGSVSADAAPSGTTVTPEAGGTVTSDDGLLVLEVPTGAVSAPVSITITRTAVSALPADLSDADAGVIAAYSFEPDGLVFATPARLTYTLGDAELADIDFEGEVRQHVLWTRSADATIEPMRSQRMTIDLDARAVVLEAELEHFSIGFSSWYTSYVSLSPSRVQGPNPMRWIARATFGSTRSRSYYLNEFLAEVGLPNPPPFSLAPPECGARGVVDIDDCPTGAAMSFSTDATPEYSAAFDCREQGTGTYTLVFAPRYEGVDPDSFDLSLVVSGRALCERAAPRTHYPTGSGLEGARRLHTYLGPGVGIPPPPRVVAWGNGVMIHRPSGETEHDLADADADIFGADVVRWEVGDATETDLVTVGAQGLAVRTFNESTGAFGLFQALLDFSNVYTALARVPDPSDPQLTTSVIAVNNTLGQAVRLAPGDLGVMVEPTPVLSSTAVAMAGIPGRLVDFEPTGDGSTYVAVTDRQLLYGTMGGAPLPLGNEDAAAGFRQIDCDGALCAATNFESHVVSFRLGADGTPDMATMETHDLVGAVGVEVQGDHITVATSSDDRLHLLTRPMGGATALCSLDLGPRCAGSTWAFFYSRPGEIVRVGASCNDSDEYVLTGSDELEGCATP